MIKAFEDTALRNGVDFKSIRQRDTGNGYWESVFRTEELACIGGQMTGTWIFKYEGAVWLLDRFKDLDWKDLTIRHAFMIAGLQLIECLRAAQWIVDTWQNTIAFRKASRKQHAVKDKQPVAAVIAKPREKKLPVSIDYEGIPDFVWDLNHPPAAVSAGAA